MSCPGWYAGPRVLDPDHAAKVSPATLHLYREAARKFVEYLDLDVFIKALYVYSFIFHLIL